MLWKHYTKVITKVTPPLPENQMARLERLASGREQPVPPRRKKVVQCRDTLDTNKAFAQSIGIDYPLLSDPDRRVATAYGVVDADQPFPSRWTFYIGVDGHILYIEKLVSPATHGRDIAAKLAELGVARRASRTK